MLFIDSRPASIGKILDNSLKLYSACFVQLAGYSAIIAIGSMLIDGFTKSILGEIPTDPAEAQVFLVTTIPAAMGFSFVASFLLFIVYAAILRRIDNRARDIEDNWVDPLKEGLMKMPTIVLAVILYTLIVLFGMLLIIPGIIFSLSLALDFNYITLENAGAYQALKQSHRLIWGHWWRTMTVFLVPTVFIVIAYFALGFVTALIGDANDFWFELGHGTIMGIFMPFLWVVCYVQYHDLKLRKTGSDLEMRLAQ